LAELTEKFENIRKETEEITALVSKEENDVKLLMDELEAEKQEKKREHKKKEEQTEKLKKESNTTDRAMRNAMQRKAQKEKLLKEKQSERSKFHDNIVKWDQGINEMRREQEIFEKEKKDLEKDRDRKVESAARTRKTCRRSVPGSRWSSKRRESKSKSSRMPGRSCPVARETENCVRWMENTERSGSGGIGICKSSSMQRTGTLGDSTSSCTSYRCSCSTYLRPITVCTARQTPRGSTSTTPSRAN
jgi:hypothetical protein